MFYDHLTVREIFNKIKETKERQDIVDILRHCNNRYFREYVKYIFDKSIDIVAPEIRENEYTVIDAPVGLADDTLWLESVFLYLFNSKSKINEQRLKNKLISAMSSLPKEEGEFFLGVIRKTLVYPNITSDILEEVFPGLIVEYDFERHLNGKKKSKK